MRAIELFRASTFRLAVLFAFVVTASTAVIFLFIYWQVATFDVKRVAVGIVKLRRDHREWQKGGMNDTRSTLHYPGFRFPAEIIGHAVWLYHRFTLSFRDIEVFWLNAGLYYWLRVFPTEETYLRALVIANLLLLPPDPV